jgi:hypothetical protein
MARNELNNSHHLTYTAMHHTQPWDGDLKSDAGGNFVREQEQRRRRRLGQR